jgi:hypothetical protein
MVVSAISIPIEWRAFGKAPLGLDLYGDDFTLNILGFLPVGLLLAGSGFWRASAFAALISLFAESMQFAMMHRDPSAIDVLANSLGGIAGAAIGVRWKLFPLGVRLNRWRAGLAFLSAIGLLLSVYPNSSVLPSPRGLTTPGTLEAHWKFDSDSSAVVEDASKNRLRGKVHGKPQRVTGIQGTAIRFNTPDDYVEFSEAPSLRMRGSMTITAWINSSQYPEDDAPIVSDIYEDFGFQLDTTIDNGPRTIGFKLSNSCAELMARYGATPLILDRWYHVAGVYDAEAKRMDVFLDGVADNGALLGDVTRTQRNSRSTLFVGRRASKKPKFNFSGSIDEVRIYSFALTPAQVAADMRGEVIADPQTQPPVGYSEESCAVASEHGDGKVPGAAAVFGVLLAAAVAGLFPNMRQHWRLALCLFLGLALIPATAALPWFSRALMPFVSLAASYSVLISIRPRIDIDL